MRIYKKVRLQEKIIKTYEEGIKELESYLALPKFYVPNNQVNINDVFLRLQETKNAVAVLEIEGGF